VQQQQHREICVVLCGSQMKRTFTPTETQSNVTKAQHYMSRECQMLRAHELGCCVHVGTSLEKQACNQDMVVLGSLVQRSVAPPVRLRQTVRANVHTGPIPMLGGCNHHSLEALLVDICAVLLQQQAHALSVVAPCGFMQRVMTGLCGGWCVCKRIGAYALRVRERKHAGDAEEDSHSEDDDTHDGDGFGLGAFSAQAGTSLRFALVARFSSTAVVGRGGPGVRS
jgi:hypothetical protein